MSSTTRTIMSNTFVGSEPKPGLTKVESNNYYSIYEHNYMKDYDKMQCT